MLGLQTNQTRVHQEGNEAAPQEMCLQHSSILWAGIFETIQKALGY